jgi:hypothetical protein
MRVELSYEDLNHILLWWEFFSEPQLGSQDDWVDLEIARRLNAAFAASKPEEPTE